MGVVDDANVILELLASHTQGAGDTKRGRYVLDGAEIAAATGLDADRINDAVQLLESKQCVDVPDVGGGHPYDFVHVELTASGRAEAEALQEADRGAHRPADARDDRLEQLVQFFHELTGRIPRDSEPSQPWQDEVVEAVAACLNGTTDALTPLVAHIVPVAKVAALKASLRRLRERAGRYSTAHNPEIASALSDINDILGKAARAQSRVRADADVQVPRPLQADQIELLALFARHLREQRKRVVPGFEIRSQMEGDRASRRRRLQELVPHYLQLHGSTREDSYSLTPLGLLHTELRQSATNLAGDLRRFVLSVHSKGGDRFTWDELKDAIRIDGRELQPEDLEFVDLVLFCLGVWGRSGTTWSRPPPEQFEDLLEIADTEELFQRVSAAVVAVNSTKVSGSGSGPLGGFVPLVVNNFNAPVGAVAAAPGAAARGAVVVHQLDDAMRSVIEQQDELGELADALLPLLRAARKVERTGASEMDLAAAVAEGDEFKNFERSLKPGVSRAAVTTARAILELVPLMKPVLRLLD